MRASLAAVLISVALVVCDCYASQAIESSLRLVGSIDNHKRAIFILRRDGATLNGQVKTFEPLTKPSSITSTAKGTIDTQGNVVLTEYSHNRRQGTFRGRLISEKLFAGTFRQARSKNPPVPVLLRSASNRSALGQGEEGIIVTENKYTHKHPHPLGRPVEQVEVSFPLVSGLADQTVVSKIQRTFGVENKSLMSLSAFMDDSDLNSVSYDVNYNRNYLLDLSIIYRGVAAHDWYSTNHLLIDLRTGNRLLAKNVFVPSSLGKIRKLAEIQLQRAARQAIKDVYNVEASEKEQVLQDQDKDQYLHQELPLHTFSLDDLDTFIVSDKGITFQYDWDFPYATRCWAPNGQFFIPYTVLQPYIRKNGPLAIFAANGTGRKRFSKAIK